jgi:hypothetical protein
MSQEPWTLFWPRSGFTPAPGLPMFAKGGAAAIYYGLGVTEHSQGSTMVMGMANLAMARSAPAPLQARGARRR